MVNVRVLALSTILLGASAQAAEVICLYDQEGQTERLQHIASVKPGARIDLDQRLVEWTGSGGSRWSVVYGGCSSIGFRVTVINSKRVASAPAKVLQVASQMADEFWDNDDAAALKKTIAQAKYKLRRDSTGTSFSIAREDYDLFEVTQEFKGGRESVTIDWVRSF